MKFNIPSQIPHSPGVYIFKDANRSILYVGKAVDLKSRVLSYFQKKLPLKTQVLTEKISQIETILVESELEALILEANLIKKYQPSFNVRLTDDKDYLYIGVTREDFPKVITLRKQDLKKVQKYWGPFPSAKTVRNTLKTLRRVFKWCSSDRRLKKVKPCFYYHLNLCAGVCAGVISQKDYQKIINSFSKFIDGKKADLMEQLDSEMAELAKERKFEQAQKIKKMVEGINYLTQSSRVELYLENPNFLEQETKLALTQLQKDLNLKKIPQRIEGYDISNILGQQAVGSMVVLTNGEIDKSQYRKFKIRISSRPNDILMHKEMLSRRLKHREWPLPDLIIIDGGRGQARAGQFQITNSKFQIPVFGLAKRLEWLYPPFGEIIKLSRHSLSLKLLQKLRDESHRFAISYHRKLRDKIFRVT